MCFALKVVLKAIMLRRQKDTLINGKPLLELPDRLVDVVACEFDEDERTFYSALETKIQAKVEKFMEQGQVMKNYTSVLVLRSTGPRLPMPYWTVCI